MPTEHSMVREECTLPTFIVIRTLSTAHFIKTHDADRTPTPSFPPVVRQRWWPPSASVRSIMRNAFSVKIAGFFASPDHSDEISRSFIVEQPGTAGGTVGRHVLIACFSFMAGCVIQRFHKFGRKSVMPLCHRCGLSRQDIDLSRSTIRVTIQPIFLRFRAPLIFHRRLMKYL